VQSWLLFNSCSGKRVPLFRSRDAACSRPRAFLLGRDRVIYGVSPLLLVVAAIIIGAWVSTESWQLGVTRSRGATDFFKAIKRTSAYVFCGAVLVLALFILKDIIKPKVLVLLTPQQRLSVNFLNPSRSNILVEVRTGRNACPSDPVIRTEDLDGGDWMFVTSVTAEDRLCYRLRNIAGGGDWDEWYVLSRPAARGWGKENYQVTIP